MADNYCGGGDANLDLCGMGVSKMAILTKKEVFLVSVLVIGTLTGIQAFKGYCHYRDFLWHSKVKRPVLEALDEISDDMATGRYESAQKKVAVLKKSWLAYYSRPGHTNCFSRLGRDFYSIRKEESNEKPEP